MILEQTVVLLTAALGISVFCGLYFIRDKNMACDDFDDDLED